MCGFHGSGHMCPMCHVISAYRAGTCVPCFCSSCANRGSSVLASGGGVIILNTNPVEVNRNMRFSCSAIRTIVAVGGTNCRTVVVGGGPRAISASCAATSGLCFRPLAPRSIVGVVSFRGPRNMVTSLNNRATVGLTRPLVSENMGVVNASYTTVRETRGHSSFRGVLRSLRVPRPRNETMAGVRSNVRTTTAVNCPILMEPSFILNNETVRVMTGRRRLHRCLGATMRVSRSGPILISGCVRNGRIRISTVYSKLGMFIPNVVRLIRHANMRSNSSVDMCPAFSVSSGIGNAVLRCTGGLNLNVNVMNLCGVRFVISGSSGIFVVRIGPHSSEAIPFLSGTANCDLTSVTARMVLNGDLGRRNVFKVCPRRGGH